MKNTNLDKNINLRKDGVLITEPKKIANLFNQFFLNLGQSGTTPQQKNSQDTLSHPSLTNFKPTDNRTLNNIFKTTKPTTAAGVDAIPGKLVNYCKEELINPILDVINSSIKESHVPTNLKISLVYPKHKKSDKHDIENYRPLAILPTISKYLEKSIHSQIIAYLDTNKKFHQFQHGFRSDKSTNTAISDLLAKITEIWEKRNMSPVFSWICGKPLIV